MVRIESDMYKMFSVYPYPTVIITLKIHNGFKKNIDISNFFFNEPMNESCTIVSINKIKKVSRPWVDL
jgi:hypothetical protein